MGSEAVGSGLLTYLRSVDQLHATHGVLATQVRMEEGLLLLLLRLLLIGWSGTGRKVAGVRTAITSCVMPANGSKVGDRSRGGRRRV